MSGLKKRGRPVKENSKGFRCEIRMTKQERDILNYLIERKEMSRTEVINDALRILYNLEKFKE